MTLVERSIDFKYDRDGNLRQSSKGTLPHLCKNVARAKDPADFVTRKNAFYQYCHNSDVVYNPTNKRNAVIFSTIPAKLEVRKAHSQIRDKLLRIKKGDVKEEEPEIEISQQEGFIFSSKQVNEKREAQFLPNL